MSLIRHILIAALYGAVAIATALTLPYTPLALDRSTAIMIGAGVLMFGAVLHEVYSRQVRETLLREELTALAADRDAVLTELSRARSEVKAIHAHLTGWAADRQAERAAVSVPVDPHTGGARIDLDLTDALVQPTGPAATDGPTHPSAHPSGHPLNGLSDASILEQTRAAVRHDRILATVHPGVSLPQRKLRFLVVRPKVLAEDRTELPLPRVRAVAEASGLVGALDGPVTFRAIQQVRESFKRGRTVSVLFPLSPATLQDTTAFRETWEFLAENPEIGQRLVIELPGHAWQTDERALRLPMDRLAQSGVRYCLRYPDLNPTLPVEAMQTAWVRLVRIPGAALIEQADSDAALAILEETRDALDRAAIDLIAADLDDEAGLRDILDLPVDFGEGRLFGPVREA